MKKIKTLKDIEVLPEFLKGFLYDHISKRDIVNGEVCLYGEPVDLPTYFYGDFYVVESKEDFKELPKEVDTFQENNNFIFIGVIKDARGDTYAMDVKRHPEALDLFKVRSRHEDI